TEDRDVDWTVSVEDGTVGVVSHYVRGDNYDADNPNEADRVEKSTRVVETLVDYLGNRGVDVVVNEGSKNAVGTKNLSTDNLVEVADAVVTVGGDGTILRTVREMSDPVPVLGINTGRVGFLAGVPPDEALDEVERLVDGYEVERRSRLNVDIDDVRVPPALNEAVVVTSEPAKIMEFDLYHGGELVESVRSDGVIGATPTGSTAYSMSAGGPLVHPEVDARLVVPLSPFRMTKAPWVLKDDAETTVVPTRSSREATVVVDGVDVAEVGDGDEVKLSKADKDALFVRTNRSFFGKVQEKLS
ncbi:MAG: NAD(+)/NADH kinase, partial [Halobacteria archaeon]|nr:NAD(+)/NADH kinase [Halobacteria archaeon]